MLCIGSITTLLHDIESPDIRYRDSLSEGASKGAGKYTLILAKPPFAGSLDYESTAKDPQKIVKTKMTELLRLALFLKLLTPGGRAAVIVPDGVLFGSSKHTRTYGPDPRRRPEARRRRETALRCVPSIRRSLHRDPVLHQTDSGGTDDVWFYDVHADGFSLDDKRDSDEANDLPDILARWQNRGAEKGRARNDQSFLVPKADIVAQGYDNSLDRYKENVHDEIEHRPPLKIIADLEDEIAKGLAELKATLS